MYMCLFIYMFMFVLLASHTVCTAIPIIIEGRFQVFQRFSSSKLVLKTVESCFMALNCYGNGSMSVFVAGIARRVNVHLCLCMYECMFVYALLASHTY
jgi:hypothetical protein